MFYPYGSNYYTSDGLNIKEYYATYRKFSGSDIWANYCLTIKNVNGVTDVFPNSNYGKTSNSKINLDSLFNSYNKKEISYNYAYEAGKYSGGNDSRMIERGLSLGYHISNTATIGLNAGSFSYSPIIYNIHYTSNAAYFYKNASYLGSISFTVLKYFCVNNLEFNNARSNIKDSSANSVLQWITLTDKMSNQIPQPPYGLNEKENNMYGIQK